MFCLYVLYLTRITVQKPRTWAVYEKSQGLIAVFPNQHNVGTTTRLVRQWHDPFQSHYWSGHFSQIINLLAHWSTLLALVPVCPTSQPDVLLRIYYLTYHPVRSVTHNPLLSNKMFSIYNYICTILLLNPLLHLPFKIICKPQLNSTKRNWWNLYFKANKRLKSSPTHLTLYPIVKVEP